MRPWANSAIAGAIGAVLASSGCGGDRVPACVQAERPRAAGSWPVKRACTSATRPTRGRGSDLPTFAGRSSLKTWLYGIARHRSLDAIKTRRRRERRLVADDDAAATAEDTTVPGALARFSAELATVLTDCLDELAPAVRDAVLLRYREGFQYDEMADLCGDKLGTLQQRVARALPVLRRCLERRLGQGASP